MKKIRLAAIVFALSMAVSLVSACSSTTENNTPDASVSQSGSSEIRERTITFGVLPSEGVNYEACHALADLIEEKSGGKITVNVMDSGVLGSEVEMLEQLRMGALDMGLIAGMMHEGIEPKMGVEGLPYLFTTSEQALEAWNTGAFGEHLKALLNDKGIEVLAVFDNGFRHVTNNVRPIYTVSDLKGIKIRVPDSIMYTDTFNSLGATAIAMGGSEIFTGLSQGTIDGQENPENNIISFKFYEVQKYMSLTSHMWSSYLVDFNKSLWDSLNDAEREVIQAAAVEAAADQNQAWQDNLETQREFIREHGVEINEVTDINEFVEAVEPIYEANREKFGDELMSIVDAIKAQ